MLRYKIGLETSFENLICVLLPTQIHMYTQLDTQFQEVPEPICVRQACASGHRGEEEEEKNKMETLSCQLHQNLPTEDSVT